MSTSCFLISILSTALHPIEDGQQEAVLHMKDAIDPDDRGAIGEASVRRAPNDRPVIVVRHRK